MRIGIIAEGRADIAVIKAVVKAITGIDGSDMYAIRPKEILDETDGEELKFSNWELVLQSCNNEQLLVPFFEAIDDEAILVVHIDTAERGKIMMCMNLNGLDTLIGKNIAENLGIM